MSSMANDAPLVIAGLLACRRLVIGAGNRGSEVGLSDYWILLHLPRGSIGDELAEVEYEDPVADGHHEVHPMLDHEHADVRSKHADQISEFSEFVVGKPAGRLIKQHQPWFGGQR